MVFWNYGIGRTDAILRLLPGQAHIDTHSNAAKFYVEIYASTLPERLNRTLICIVRTMCLRTLVGIEKIIRGTLHFTTFDMTDLHIHSTSRILRPNRVERTIMCC